MVVKGQQGKQLERLVDMTNTQYRNTGRADIRKIPTPTTVIRYERGRIRDGVYTKGEWVDYVGLAANGRAIAFDAKETRETTRFDLMKNLHMHQYEFLKSWHEKGANTFLIVCFIKRQYETYLLPFEKIDEFYKEATAGGKKSIPYQFFVLNCERVKQESGIVLHYLKGVFE